MKKKRSLLKVFLITVILGCLFLTYSHLESRWVKNEYVDIVSKGLPKAFEGKRIVFITDIHHGPYLSIERVQKLVTRINALEPDIILLGGDYVHREAKYIKPLFDAFQELNAPLGIYGVLGNHDHWEDAELTAMLMKRNGIQICDNHSYDISLNNESIRIGGVGDLWEDEQFIEATTNNLRKDDFSILISHSPDYIEQISNDKIDLVVAGHTHGGQMTLFGLWAPIIPSKHGQKYRYGLKQFDHLQAYISSGVGTITPPVRFFCRPEVVVFGLKRP